MICPNCGTNNAPVKKCCYRCGTVLSGYAINNVTGEYGYRNPDGSFTTTKETTMDKKTQDLAWTCLPKETRCYLRAKYRESYINSALKDTLKRCFGKHNLTSDAEPEEMLMTPISKAREQYAIYRGSHFIQDIIHTLFGDKCLPDKPSVQVEPKFKVGELAMNYGKKCRILEYNPDIKFPYLIHILYNNLKTNVSESDLEPYTEPKPKFKVGDKVRISLNPKNPFDEPKWLPEMDKFKGQIVTLAKQDPDGDWEIEEGQIKFSYSERWLEPYPEPETKDAYEQYCQAKADEQNNQTKGNMEEKELNLCELLEVYKVDSIYSVVHDAEVDFKLSNGYIEFMGLGFYSNGSMYDVAGRCMLYPSRPLYEKYPLDPYSAWMEWKESRKQKYIFEIEVSSWVDGEDGRENEKYDGKKWFKFDSAKELKQAAEAVRETLMKFHERANDK